MKSFFTPDVSIRLNEDGNSFVVTTRYSKLYAVTSEFALESASLPDALEENAVMPVRKRDSRRNSGERQLPS
jgi:hypothetical protein